jgi:eukaryotic-like serine/threonine-protein kinase
MTDLRAQLQSSLGVAYILDRELGGGGMSRVFVAQEVALGRTVVVKVIAPELAEGVSAERFARELKFAARLQQANIVPVLSAGSSGALPYFTMPFVTGESLRVRLSSGAPVSVGQAINILRDIARALAYAHAEGVVHRDIKPENILLSGGTAVVTDFGIAKALSVSRESGDSGPVADLGTLTQVGTSLGTPAYMAPEQAAADPNVDHRADIYALGVVAYEMFSGRVPFTGTPQQVLAAHVMQEPPALRSVSPEVPATIAAIVMRCLEKDPAVRFQTANAFLAAVEGIASPSATAGASGIGSADAAHAAGSAVWSARTSANRARTRGARVIAAAFAVLALVLAIYASTAAWRRERWVRTVGLPRLVRLTEAREFDSAFVIAQAVAAVAPRDSTLAAILPAISTMSVIASDPPGATVYRAPAGDTTAWTRIGTTPTDSTRIPNGWGLWRYEKQGYSTLVQLARVRPDTARLISRTDAHPEMARIGGGTFHAFLADADTSHGLVLRPYRMDLFEVSNQQYKAFVDAGGYTDRRWWTDTFVDGGRTLTFAETMARFVDRTGRPGPSTWESGDFPAGQAQFPVSGVSWFEAAAYARFAHKALPTVYHWFHAADAKAGRWMAAGSNVDAKGPLPVGTLRGVSAYGVSDMVGNAREWQANESDSGERYILGGGWNETINPFPSPYAQPALDRQEANGIRLALYDSADTNLEAARAAIRIEPRDYAKTKPASDAVFAGYRRQFEYDAAPLDVKVEFRDTTSAEWNREQISFTAAYGGERMSAWVYSPKHPVGRMQSVVYFPGGNSIQVRNSRTELDTRGAFVTKTGRLLVFPIMKSMFERGDSLHDDTPNRSIFFRDHVVMWVKDVRRTLDYLTTRPDVDSTKFAYFGISMGGYMAGLVPAVEPRLKAAVVVIGGLTDGLRDEIDPFNYVSRIKVPVMMLNGRYDYYFPLRTAQAAFFRNLGTPAADKRWVVYDGAHEVPRTEMIKETLAFLDKYLGPSR